MARQPNYKRMYNDTVNLLKLKKSQLPQKEEEQRELPEDFKDNGMEFLKNLMEDVSCKIQYFEENKGNRLVPPTLRVLAGRLLKVDMDMEKINRTLVKVEVTDYEKAYNEVMLELQDFEMELALVGGELEGQQEIEG